MTVEDESTYKAYCPSFNTSNDKDSSSNYSMINLNVLNKVSQEPLKYGLLTPGVLRQRYIKSVLLSKEGLKGPFSDT